MYAGVTLIELLVVISVIGVLAGAVIALINPSAAFDRARIAKGKAFQGSLTRTLGYYQSGVWNFNDGVSPGADNSGNQNLAVLTNGASHIADCGIGLEGCISFDGVDDYVQIADSPALDLTSAWTIGGWFRPEETILTVSDRQVLISKWQTSAGTLINYYLYISTGGKAISSVGNGSASQSVISTTTLQPNTWYYINATFSGTTGRLKIYIDGKLENTTATGYTSSYANTGNVRLGQYDFGWSGYRDEYKGRMDDITIYGQEVSQAAIQQFYSDSLARHTLAYSKNK